MRSAEQDPDELDDRIAALEADIAAVGAAGPPVTERVAAALEKLDRDREFFLAYGFDPGGPPPYATQLRERALRGALMLAAADAIRQAERERIERTAAASARLALSGPEKERQLGELRAKLRRLLAARELGWREQEKAATAFIERPDADAEMFLLATPELTRIAEGREAS